MRKIFKYHIWDGKESVADDVSLDLPDGAEILHVDFQHDSLCLWALIDPEFVATNVHSFRVAGTGHPIEEKDFRYLKHLASLKFGPLMFHVFETTEWKAFIENLP